jgi:hypothetical protein
MHRTWLAAALALLLVGCNRSPPVSQIWAVATSPTGGRSAAAGQLVAQWKAGSHQLDEAIDLAFEQLDAVKDNTPAKSTGVVPKSADATAFAGAVLDAIEALGSKLPQDSEREMFWMRVGGLAFAASEEAFGNKNPRLAEARTLIFAGGVRWQNEAYWVMHSGHDALASVVLAQSGERGEARLRLENRTDINGLAAQVLEDLRQGK